MRFLVGALAAAAVFAVSVARAQVPSPMPDVSPAADPRLSGSATTDIPVKMPGGTEVMAAEGSATSTASAPIALEQPLDPDVYVCGAGDTFELNFWGQQNFRIKAASDLEGRVFVSKVGFVNVAGKTLTAVRSEVSKKVRANYPGLQFAFSLLVPRTFVVHVAENVLRPGAYTATPVERVSAVLTRAGGASGSKRRIQVKRRSGATLDADLILYELTGDTKYNPFVLDGDVIVVPAEGTVATIEGAVRRPGRYELINTKDVSELLGLAGGLKSTAVRTLPLRVVHRQDNQHDQFVDLSFKAGVPNTALVDEDRVIVRSSDELQRSVQLIGAIAGADTLDQATTAKRLTYIDGDTVLSLIDRAGGIKAPGDLSRSYISRARANGPAELIPIDLEALLVRRDYSADKPISMGDVIVVPPMQYSVRVEGAVARAGLYPFNPKFGVAEYVATAGGRTRSARDIDEATLIERTGRTRSYSKSLRPSPGDSILVPERNFTRPEIVQIMLATAGLVLSGVALSIAATR